MLNRLFDVNVRRSSHLVKSVKKFLTQNGIKDVDFFIGGGSVFGSIYNTEYHDVDVFFYRQEDIDLVSDTLRNKVENTLAFNASTITLFDNDTSIIFQFITKPFSSVDMWLKTVDISCCACSIDSNFKFKPSTNFSNKIRDPIRLEAETIKRIFKYISRGVEVEESTLLNLIDNFTDDLYKVANKTTYYGRNVSWTNLDLLTEIAQNGKQDEVVLSLMKKYSGSELIEIFEIMNVPWSLSIEKPLEFIVAQRYREYYSNLYPELVEKAKTIYPEYYI